MDWHALLLHPLVQWTLAGWIVAARIDYEIFLTWDGPEDVKAYDWKRAAFRQLKGIVTGVVGGLSTMGAIQGLFPQ